MLSRIIVALVFLASCTAQRPHGESAYDYTAHYKAFDPLTTLNGLMIDAPIIITTVAPETVGAVRFMLNKDYNQFQISVTTEVYGMNQAIMQKNGVDQRVKNVRVQWAFFQNPGKPKDNPRNWDIVPPVYLGTRKLLEPKWGYNTTSADRQRDNEHNSVLYFNRDQVKPTGILYRFYFRADFADGSGNILGPAQ